MERKVFMLDIKGKAFAHVTGDVIDGEISILSMHYDGYSHRKLEWSNPVHRELLQHIIRNGVPIDEVGKKVKINSSETTMKTGRVRSRLLFD